MAEESHKVILNVYDLSQGMARQLSSSFLGKVIEGIWHTGVVVYGNEYYFGGGIQNDPAGRTPYGTPVKVVDLGITHVSQDVFEMYLDEISPRYTAETYSLLTHNCNNFSNEVAQFLVGVSIPDFILQLPNEVLSSPMGALIMPMIQNLETTLRAGAVPQVPQFRPATATTTNPSPASAQTAVNGSSRKSSGPSTTNTAVGEANSKDATVTEKSIPPAVKPSEAVVANGVAGDPLGDARSKVQEEIGREFAALMATGTLRASEAAALATRKVMQRYGGLNVAV
ncbi:Desumoylating isopeptidase 1 [Euphorbia peplus]|nr:Desumoylating isopeptidase 1 [Euphorbia peplus]